MSASLAKLQVHKYLTHDETLERRVRMRQFQWTALVATILGVVLAVIASRRGGGSLLGSLKLEEAIAWLVVIGSLVWFFRLAYLERQFVPAGVKELERLRPMLDGDAAIRSVVAGWTQGRPLQLRDARFLLWLLPQWEQERAASEFATSLSSNEP